MLQLKPLDENVPIFQQSCKAVSPTGKPPQTERMDLIVTRIFPCCTYSGRAKIQFGLTLNLTMRLLYYAPI